MAYHPQLDGQTEHINQELEQYIWVFVNECQDDWDTLLLLAEFAYNNHTHSTMQHTPFFIDTGWHPHMDFKPHQPASKVEVVNEFANHMKSALEEACAALVKSKDDMVRYYNQQWTPAPMFEVGNKVFLDVADISMTWPTKKFVHQFLGPYSIVHPVGSHAYHLKLPPLMSHIHHLPCCQTHASSDWSDWRLMHVTAARDCRRRAEVWDRGGDWGIGSWNIWSDGRGMDMKRTHGSQSATLKPQFDRDILQNKPQCS
jgi:hypothetical protein